MDNTFRKGKIALLCCLIFCTSFVFRATGQRPVKTDKVREASKENLIESAERWLGVRELSGRNDHPMITAAMKLCGLPGNAGYPWCAACQAEIHEEAGLHAPTSARVTDWFTHGKNSSGRCRLVLMFVEWLGRCITGILAGTDILC